MRRRFLLLLATAGLLVGGVPAQGAAPSGGRAGPCRDLSRACVIEVATTYIVAQADSSKRSGARVAPDVQRWENGIHNARSAEDIRGGSTEDDSGFTGLLSTRDLDRVLVDGDQAVFYWIMDVQDPVTGTYVATAHISERFQLATDRCGDELSPCITEIEAIFCIGNTGHEEAKPAGDAGLPGGNILCHRES
jgi:hypothetical protein